MGYSNHIALINKSQKILDGKKLEIKEQFKDGTFNIEYKGSLSANGTFNVLSEDTTELGLKSATIQGSNATSNELIQALINQVEVHSFIEKIPSINEIFISHVKGGNHE